MEGQQATAGRIPITLREKLRKELQRMKDNNIIEETTVNRVDVTRASGYEAKRNFPDLCGPKEAVSSGGEKERYMIPTFDGMVNQVSNVF